MLITLLTNLFPASKLVLYLPDFTEKRQNSCMKMFIGYSYETIDGTAEAGSDYIGKKELLQFLPDELHKYIDIVIIDDNEWEPDETFFVKLWCDPQDTAVKIGKHSVTEITIINDDGNCRGFSTYLTLKVLSQDKRGYPNTCHGSHAAILLVELRLIT